MSEPRPRRHKSRYGISSLPYTSNLLAQLQQRYGSPLQSGISYEPIARALQPFKLESPYMLVSTHQIRGEGSARSARSLLTPELSVHTETSGTVADRQELGQDLSILEKDGSHERSYDRVCSAVQRDFSFKSTLQEESAAREMQDTAAATMTEAMRKGILDVHSRVVLLIEICGEHAWQSKNQQIVLELKKALQLVKTRQSKDTDGVTSEGFSIMQYATVAQHEGRLGAFEVYAQFFSNKTANPLSILLHSKLQTQRFPNANAMMRFLCEMLPRVTDARKFRLVLADLSDDNIELRSDLKNSSEQCKSVEHRLKNVVDKYEALQIADQGRQHTVLRAIKELTRIKKHVDKLADQLNENLTNEESLLTENTADHSCAQREACDGMIQNSSNLCASNNPPRETCAEVCDKGGSAFALCEKIQVGVSLVMKNLSGERVCEEFQQWQEELRFERAQCSKTIASMDAELQSLDEKLEALSHRMLHLQANAAGAETELQSLREQLSASHNSHEHLTLQLAEAISERDELVAELKKAADAQVLDSFSQAQDVAQKVDNPLLAMAGQMEELENSLAKMMVAIPQNMQQLRAKTHHQQTKLLAQQEEQEQRRKMFEDEIGEYQAKLLAQQAQHELCHETLQKMADNLSELELDCNGILQALHQHDTAPKPVFAFQVRLVGCKKATGSDFSLVNGDYTRTDLEANGLPVYIKDQNKSPALWYDSVDRSIGGWRVGPPDKLGSTVGYASVMCDAVSPERAVKAWKVFLEGEWQEQSEVSIVKLDTGNKESKETR